MIKIFRIMLAWWFWTTNQNDILATERLQICARCQYRKWFVCSLCGCPIGAKSRDPEEFCPVGKWRV
jgi:hypothetical protein